MQFNAEEIENAFVQFFIEINNISVNRNQLILDILKSKKNIIKQIKELIQQEFSAFSLKDLEKAFELLIPEKDRKLNGAFFTPSIITNYISKELITSPDQNICDPSCGCGAFLTSAVEIIHEKFRRKIIDIIEKNIHGIDILDYSVRRCKIILTLQALVNGEDEENIKFNIYKQDSLSFDWKSKFSSIAKDGGFDLVIGNPPYVKFQDLPDDIRKDLYTNWKTLNVGTYNLYFAFFELGITILNKAGRLGYITPNNYFTSLAAINLRRFLQQNKYVEKIIDFNHLKIFESQTYTAITFLNKKSDRNKQILFERIDDRTMLLSLEKTQFSKVDYLSLDSKKWRLLRGEDQANIKKIETTGSPLGSLFDIRVGIATCKDNIYFIDGNTLKDGFYRKTFEGKIYNIEADITRPVIKISDFKDQRELNDNKRRIIFPYYIRLGKAYLLRSKELKETYPECYKYLLEVKPELEQRDKGKVKYDEWYAYARTQGLSLCGAKLVTPTFSDSPRFLYEKKENALFCNGYAIFKKKGRNLFDEEVSLETLSKILNSKIMEYYIGKTSVSIEGGYPCYQKNFIERFTIPKLKQEHDDYLENEKNQQKIDSFLAKIYGLKVPI